MLVAIGGSATCDGGTGLAQALGAKFFDEQGALIREPLTGGQLLQIRRVERPSGLPPIDVACDVENPLCGPHGAAAVYAPQKGATPEQVAQLEAGLRHLAGISGADPNTLRFGAAGGAAFGLAVFCGATLHRGIDLVLDAIGFDEACRDASLVLTGEGRLDDQSLHGKACFGVAQAAMRRNVPTIAIVGSFGPGASRCVLPSPEAFLLRAVSLADRFGEERARREVAILLERAAREVVTDWLAART
jgi:glycerate kinase